MKRFIPENFAQTYIEMFGEDGKRWLAELPEKIASLEQRWNIQVLLPFALSYNYVAPAIHADGRAVVLKLGYPNDELTSEITALEQFAGRGIVQLLESDSAEGVFLMERLEPGVPLVDAALDDETGTRIAAGVMQELWIPAPAAPENRLITVAKWGKGLKKLRATYNGGTGPFPEGLVDWAEKLYVELMESPGPSMLLHGGLHHWNILTAQRAPWLALDPKGVIGEVEYEVGAFLRNPWPDMPGVDLLLRALPRRLAIFHEMLGFDIQRMLAWSLYQAVLSSWWTYEDHHHVGEEMIAFAEGLQNMLRGG